MGLVLKGGGALGISHVGVLKVLEELRVPIDCIAGTSMGAIVGGLYASGMDAKTLERTVQEIDWKEIFTDRPPRRERDFRRKLEDEGLLLPYRIGVGSDKPGLPRGLILGQQLTLALRGLSSDAAGIRDFDRLPIPYRAIAADIETGETVVLGQGDLAMAMRASMAVSGIFPPVEIEGRLLVDGGLANNLPVDVARDMGADILIVSDIPAQLKEGAELNSAAAIVAQSIALMILRSSQAQLETLTDQDILLQPDLAGFDSSSFDRGADMVPRGVAATRAQAERLLDLALSPTPYRYHVAARPAIEALPSRIAFVEVDNRSSVADEVILERLSLAPGDALDLAQLERDIATIYGLDYFESVTYRLVNGDEGTGVVVLAREKTIGLDTFRAGLNLQYDISGGSEFSIAGQLRLAGLDELGAELLINGSLGQTNALDIAYLQPLDSATRYYIVPRIRLNDREVGRFENGDRTGELRVQEVAGSLTFARQVSTWGIANLTMDYGLGRQEVRSGPPLEGDDDFTIARVIADARYDTVDNLYFPKDGEAARLAFRKNLRFLNDGNEQSRASAEFSTTNSWGKYTLRAQANGGTTIDAQDIARDRFTLGGFFALSGYAENELVGDHLGFANLIGYRDFGESTPFFDLPLILGGSVETAAIWNDGEGTGPLRLSGSIFAGADTPIGPLYLGYGVGGINRHALYFVLGQQF